MTEKQRTRRRLRPQTDCLIPPHAYLDGHDGPFSLPEHLCGAAGELFRAGGADAGGRTPADQIEPAAGAPSRPRSGPARPARRAPRSWPASAIPDGADPIAMAYAGHQFGHFVPQLGDGRAILLGEVIDADGVRRDIQLKGSGPTPFSRRGDGRAALGPVLREYIVSEAMAALGIPTTRSLAAVVTGESVMRETLLPGAVLTRVASSHIRVGTFQYFAARGDTEGGAAAGGSRHRPALPGSGRRRPPLSRAAGRRDRAAGRAGRALAAGRLHPWRHEHRQHLDIGRDHRLRSVRLHGQLRSGDGVQLDRRTGPLRLRQSAADRALEPDPAGRMPVAAVFRRSRTRPSPRRRRRSAISPRNSTPPTRPACGASSACSRPATAIRRWRKTCWTRWPRTRPTSR